MKKPKFIYNVRIDGVLSRKEADLIFTHLEKHPDTVRYTKQGEFGFSFVNYYKDMDVETEFNFKEIDKMLKALELPIMLDSKLKLYCIMKLSYWAQSINEEVVRLNKW